MAKETEWEADTRDPNADWMCPAEREKGHVCRATHRVRRHRETAGRRKLRTDLGKVIFCGHPREDV